MVQNNAMGGGYFGQVNVDMSAVHEKLRAWQVEV
jgi:hypothetical protein